MKRILFNSNLISAILVALVFVLALARLAYWGSENMNAVEESETLVGVSLNVLTGIVIALGAVFSYFRFFHGRLFAQRIEISHASEMLKKENEVKVLETIVCIKNIGTIPIWNPQVELQVICLNEKKDGGKLEEVPLLISDHLIETSEDIYRTFHHEVDSSWSMVTYRLSIVSNSFNHWEKVFSVSLEA